MLSREDFYMIKQMRQQGAYIVDIATQVGCSERTVRRYLKYPEPPARKTRHKMVKLKPFMDYIDMRLAENIWNSEVILAEIKAMGYTGGRSMLRYYIQPKRKMRPSKRTVRFETQPGYQLQHDWGEVELEVAGQRCKVNFAVNTLGFSRRFHVFAAPKQDAEHTYESLVRAFRYFGGSVKTVLVDNQKAAVLKNNNGKVVFNSGFLLLADHYDFLPRACRPRRARTKGKVERMVKYLKENFFVRYRRFDSFTHVNQQLEQWMADVADKRELRQFRQTPEQRFALEQEHLQPLPVTDFDTSYFDSGYDQLYKSGRVTEAGCMAHARRKFYDVHVRTPTAETTEALRRFAELYAIEAEIRGSPAEERLAVRQERSLPLMESLNEWRQQQNETLSSISGLKGAFNYLSNQWDVLNTFCHNGWVELDNNIAENALRLVALGRKNYLFVGSASGGENAALMYSLIVTCKLNGVDPQEWLRYVISEIADWPSNRVRDLMPWKAELPRN
ncbi:IS21 family transposase [Serratia fonticola]